MIYVIKGDIKDKDNLNINYLNYRDFKDINKNNDIDKWPFNYIEAIKSSILHNDDILIEYEENIISCLQALNIDFTICYYIDDREFAEKINSKNYKIIPLSGDNIEEKNGLSNIENNDSDKDVNENSEDVNENSEEIDKDHNSDELVVKTDSSDIPKTPKTQLTLAELLEDDVNITDADVIELKLIQNKLKVGMLLQAKSSLTRVLKLSNVLDKLYDELFDRISEDLTNSDTASLMVTADYISKALSETNQFITSLINNEKIQNFFLINDSVININKDQKYDSDTREKIRKAVDVVINNLDYFVKGDYKNVIDPNEIEEGDNNA